MLTPTVVLPGPERPSESPPQEVSVRVQAVGTGPTTLGGTGSSATGTGSSGSTV